MPNGVTKSKRTAAACRKRAIKKQQEEDKKKQLEAEREQDNLLAGFARQTIGIEAYARKLSTYFKGLGADIIGYRKIEGSTPLSTEIIRKNLHEIILENKDKIVPKVIRGLKKNGRHAWIKLFKKLLNCFDYTTKFDPNAPHIAMFLAEGNIVAESYDNIVFVGYRSIQDILKQISSFVKAGMGFTDEMKALDDGFQIAQKIAYNPPKVWDEKKNNKDYETIKIGCFGSIWIDYQIDGREYRVAVYNYDKDAEGMSGMKKWDGTFNPALTVNPN